MQVLGGSFSTFKHLIPCLQFRTEHAKKHDTNAKRIYGIALWLNLSGEMTLSDNGKKIIARSETSITFKCFAYKCTFCKIERTLFYNL